MTILWTWVSLHDAYIFYASKSFPHLRIIYDNEEVFKYIIIVLACARSKIELKGYGRKLVTVKLDIRWALLADLKVTVQQPHLWPDRIPRCVSIIERCHY